MFQPADVLILIGLATAFDNLSTAEILMIKNTIAFLIASLLGLFFFLVDMGIYRPAWRVLSRAQQGVPAPTGEQYWDIFKVYLQNWTLQFLLTPFYAITEDFFGYTTEPPTWSEILLDSLRYVVMLSVWTYTWHRMVHHPALYGRIHKKHHKFKAPVVLECFYFTVIENLLGFFIPLMFLGMFAVRSQWTRSLVYWYTLIAHMFSHCGYKLPFISDGIHDAHHEFFDVNYSAFIVMDIIFGTYLDSEGLKTRRLKKITRAKRSLN